MTDEPERAVSDYDQALRLDPGYVAAYDHRGRVHAWMNREEAAARNLELMLAFDAIRSPSAVESEGISRIEAQSLVIVRDCSISA